jgi:CRP-like cAMP-binding protein
VTARSDVELWALERDIFIAAVTGHAPSAEAADAVISTHLGSASRSVFNTPVTRFLAGAYTFLKRPRETRSEPAAS